MFNVTRSEIVLISSHKRNLIIACEGSVTMDQLLDGFGIKKQECAELEQYFGHKEYSRLETTRNCTFQIPWGNRWSSNCNS